jgi:hypothetical protein
LICKGVIMPGYRAGLFLSLLWVLLGCSPALSATVLSTPGHDPSPRNATFLIDGERYPLSDGQVTVEAFPGAASKTVVQLFGEPVNGDLDLDGVADAAVLLVQTTGGSGTFYYVAVALNRGGTFSGTEAVFIGDRIAPLQIAIRHGVVILDYADRLTGEAMATAPSAGRSKYLVVRKKQLEVIALAEGEVVIGHEVRSFTPCGASDAIWLVGNSPALPEVQVAYHQAMSEAPPYTPLFMVLTGRSADSPADGFGADYPAGFRVLQLVHVLPGTNCPDLE